jgi:cinnamoyl-CoA reductase
MVTGANGFIASYIVKQLLEKGYKVRGCVRDASKPEKVNHLLNLPNANENLVLFSTGDLAATKPGCFDTPMSGCDAVFHAATSLYYNLDMSAPDAGENLIYKPAMASTHELLDCISRKSDTVRSLILTSSMASLAPRPEPKIKDESHWSDPEELKARGSWYSATKTLQEKLVQDWVELQKQKGSLSKDFKYCSICPTVVMGPVLNADADATSGTTGFLLGLFEGARREAPNDSMSFIHVEDCARMHTNALDIPEASGRYMCLVESWHWNEIYEKMGELYPLMPNVKPYEGRDKVVPTKFDLVKMGTLGVKVRSIEQILKDSLSYLQAKGALEK